MRPVRAIDPETARTRVRSRAGISAATGRLLVLDIKKRLAAVLVLAVAIALAADGAGIHWDHVLGKK